MLGRVLPNLVADVIGPLNILIPTMTMAAILLFSWLRCTSWQGFIIFGIFYGFFSGTLVSLPPACLSVLTAPEMSKIGVRMGMSYRYHRGVCR
jgi:fucose 4-O-acetylase-like acetyltransferase